MRRIDTEGFPRKMKVWGLDKNYSVQQTVLGLVMAGSNIEKAIVINKDGSLRIYFHAEEIDPLGGLKVRDIIVSNSEERKVLGICGEVVFVSCANDFTTATSSYYTVEELRRKGYSIKG